MNEEQIQALYDKIELLEFKQELLLDLLKSNDRHLDTLSEYRLEGFFIKHNLSRKQFQAVNELTTKIREEYDSLNLRRASLFGTRMNVRGLERDQVETLIYKDEYEYHLSDIIPECENKEMCIQIARITGLYNHLYGETARQLKDLSDEYNRLDEESEKIDIDIEDVEEQDIIPEYEEEQGREGEYNFSRDFDELRQEFETNYHKSQEILDTFRSYNLTSITKFYDEGFEDLEQEQSVSDIKTTKQAIFNNKFKLEHHGMIDIINNSDQDDSEFRDMIEYIFDTRDHDYVRNISYMVKTYRMMEHFNTLNHLSVSDCETILNRLENCNELLTEVNERLNA